VVAVVAKLAYSDDVGPFAVFVLAASIVLAGLQLVLVLVLACVEPFEIGHVGYSALRPGFGTVVAAAVEAVAFVAVATVEGAVCAAAESPETVDMTATAAADFGLVGIAEVAAGMFAAVAAVVVVAAVVDTVVVGFAFATVVVVAVAAVAVVATVLTDDADHEKPEDLHASSVGCFAIA
jgi:hypothetical protein